MTEIDADRFAFRPESAARALDVSLMTVNTLLRDGRLPGRKLGGATLILRSDIMAMVELLPLAAYAPLPQKMVA